MELGVDGDARLLYDVAHNIAKVEKHHIDGVECTCCVHRKGATRAFAGNHSEISQGYADSGQPVLVPGDMGTGSWLLSGPKQGTNQAFGSSWTCNYGFKIVLLIYYSILNIVNMSWTDEKVNKLKDLWGKGQTASQIAEIIGGVSRNAVIGKAHRLNLSAKIKTRSAITNNNVGSIKSNINLNKGSRKQRFRSLLLDKNFEPAKNLQLEDLNEQTCKYMEGHPDEKDSSFCGRKTIDKFSYCPLHLMIVFQPKGKKDDEDKDEEVPRFIEKKVKSA